jgi:hypothetical protein
MHRQDAQCGQDSALLSIDERVILYTRGSPIRPAVQYGGIYETAGGYLLRTGLLSDPQDGRATFSERAAAGSETHALPASHGASEGGWTRRLAEPQKHDTRSPFSALKVAEPSRLCADGDVGAPRIQCASTGQLVCPFVAPKHKLKPLLSNSACFVHS